jgi:hypothetical protein
MSELLLRGPTLVIIDWANVYGWRKELKIEPDPKKNSPSTCEG